MSLTHRQFVLMNSNQMSMIPFSFGNWPSRKDADLAGLFLEMGAYQQIPCNNPIFPIALHFLVLELQGPDKVHSLPMADVSLNLHLLSGSFSFPFLSHNYLWTKQACIVL